MVELQLTEFTHTTQPWTEDSMSRWIGPQFTEVES